MGEIQYLLDENLNPRMRNAMMLAAPQITVLRVGDADVPSLGTKDPEILVWCEEHNFILVTDNRTSMPVHLADHIAEGKHCPSIFVLPPDYSIGEIVDELILIYEASLSTEYQDQIRFLPISE
ncbi:MAG: DUF5615 family PIN-like protein [Chloroflexota bacterium]